MTAAIAQALGVTDAVLDGEIAHLGRDGEPKLALPPALDQKRGQAPDPKVVKHSWENTFDRL